MIYMFDLAQQLCCTRFGRMLQQNRWNRQGITQKNVNLLVYVISGTAVFSIGETKHHIKTGDALFIPSNTPYSADTEDMCDYYFFHFTGTMNPVESLGPYPKIERDFSFELPQFSNRKIIFMERTETADAYSKFYTYLTECEDLHNSATFSGRLAIDNILCRLLLALSQIAEQRHFTTGYPMALEKMLSYIRKNITKTITSADLCRYCGISESYAARIFKRYLNTTMTRYITDQKLVYACELMRNTGMNVSQIASYLGFCDVFYFSRRFKERYGMSPTRMFEGKY